MPEKQKLDFRGTATPEELKTYLTALAESFGRGPVVLESGGRHVVLEMGTSADFEIEAEQKKDKAKVTIDISWRLPMPAVSATSSGLKISTEVPPVVATLSDAEDDELSEHP